MQDGDAEGPRSSSAPITVPTIDELVLAGEPDSWTALGFTVVDRHCQLGAVRLCFAGREGGTGLIGWSLRGVSNVELDGLPTAGSTSPVPEPAPVHPNGVRAIDHVVVMSPALDRTARALERAGLKLRRIREQPTPSGAPRQAFFRLGAEILEVVQEPPDAIEHGGADRPARLWGLALVVDDLDRVVQCLGSAAGAIRPAVQPGRRIAPLRRSAGLAIPIAFMGSRDGDP